MLFSSVLTKNAIENYNKENYNTQYPGARKKDCMSFLILAVILLVIEIALLYYAITIALTAQSPELKFVNVILAITMTLPYLLLNVLFNPAARAALGESGSAPSLQFRCGMW